MKVLSVLACVTLIGCGASAESSYHRYEAEGVDICDLKTIDTFEFLGADTADRQSYLDVFTEKNWYVEIKNIDINITHCSHDEHPYHGDEALRVIVDRDLWQDGFMLTYDLYFDENDQLTAIEGRHLYIAGHEPA